MKKKILMLAVAACLIVLSLASSSLAYFTDTTEVKNAVFTPGKVDIELTFTGFTEGTHFFLDQTYTVPATVTVASDSEDAYVGAKIVFKTTSAATETDVTNILTAFNLTPVNTINDTENKTLTVYVVNTSALAANGTWKVLENAKFDKTLNNTTMAIFNNLDVSVTAYAVQTEGLGDDAGDALARAFGEWDFNNAYHQNT